MMIENSAIFEKNLLAYKKNYSREIVKYSKLKKEEPKLIVENLADWGEYALQVTTSEGRQLVLNYLIGGEESLLEEHKNWGKILPRTPIFIVGMGNIRRIKSILEMIHEECLMVVYEPSLEIFDYAMTHWDISEILENPSVALVVEPLNGGELEDVVKRLITVDTMSMFKEIVSENYDQLYFEETKKVLERVKKSFQDVIVNWNTAKRYSDVVGINVMYNIRHMLHGYNVRQLKNFLRGEIPAIVISAGPSLNKNIDELKKIQGKACLIAVDTAIKPLLNRRITPDFFVIVDGKKPTELMEHPDVSKVALVTSPVVANGIMDLHTGKKFFYFSGAAIERKIYEICEKAAAVKGRMIPKALDTGGSVANTAFALAHYMNASEIILVGQDLAITNGRTHADGTFKEKMDKISEEKRAQLIPVEGIRGNTVFTRRDFKRYLDWFGNYIKKHNIKKVIDATQGGAKIQGTKIMSLNRAIEKVKRETIELEKKIGELPEMMDWAAKKSFVGYYQAIPNKIDEVYRVAKRGERLYKKMQKVVLSEETGTEDYRKLLKRIEKVNKFMNDNQEALFVQGNLEHLNFMMRMGIYNQEENELDEQIQIAKHGKVLNFFIKFEAKKFKEKIRQIVQDRPVSMTEDDIQEPLDKLMYQLEKGYK